MEREGEGNVDGKLDDKFMEGKGKWKKNVWEESQGTIGVKRKE